MRIVILSFNINGVNVLLLLLLHFHFLSPIFRSVI